MTRIFSPILVIGVLLLSACSVPSASAPTPALAPTPSPSTSQQQTANGSLESYYVIISPESTGRTMMLKTVGSWKGSSSYDIHLEIDKSPWVVNANYTRTSQIESSFQVVVQSEEEFKQGSCFANFLDEYHTVFEGTGSYVIRVFASGCEWWVKVGVEP